MNDSSNTIGIFTESVPYMACPSCEAELDVSDFAVFEDIECPNCHEPIKVPGRLGDFILIDELGRGAMGCVYLAQDETLGRLVALKVIRKEFGEDPKMLETVQREAQAMASLNHRNICQVYSFGRVQNQPYFVMEMLTGERLDEMMSDGGTVPEIRALEIALDVAHGLDAADQAGLTHGDIKPANILMNDKGVAKVVDFGLARFMDPDAEIEVWGTPYYIAPEKARKQGEDSRSDQFSLGATLFHVLAGHPPYEAETPTKVVIASLKEETPVLKEQNPVITDKTSAVILRMMDKNPNRRYPTYASLLADLEMALQGAKAAQQQAREDERQARQKANRGVPSFVWMLLGGLLLTVIVGGGLYLRHQKQQRQLAAVVYDGPRRELHQPFTKVEIRNLSLTAEGLAGLNFRQTDTALATAVKYLPERHAVTGWYHFFGAGLYFYAGKAELAREELRRVAEMNTMMFDGGRVPPEDPRILAYFALGDLSEEELGKTLRKSQGYYKQLATLARGYRSFFQDGATPQTAKFFKTFAEYRPYTGMAWPYVIQPLCSEMVLPRENDLYESFTVPSPGAPDEVSRVPSTLNPPVAYGSFAAS